MDQMDDDGLTLSDMAADDSLAWHSDHPVFWRWFGYYWLQIRYFIWRRGGSKLFWSIGKQPPAKKWWIRWCYPGHSDPCQSCGYSWDWGDNDGWFKCEGGGGYSGGDYTVHWFEGTQTCPRCRMSWYYSDSD
jgi:hypothetical protein